ncbi:MAG TPA: DUF2442 domain-containing protein [Bacteroidia bacterium]|jgi:hypothetical protein|nr:DUF2442 domain-containing protein [Bacteroidia bacterium]
MLVSDVKYIKDYVIEVTLRTGEVKRYDLKKWLFSDINPILYKFRKLNHFKKVRVENGIIVWGDDEMDFTPDHMVEMEVNHKEKIPRDNKFSRLLKEGRKSQLLSPLQAKNQLKRRGINV